MKQNNRIERIDALKGLAIIAVVLYHLGAGILPCGYYGVDIFLVISGFFLTCGYLRQRERNTYTYWGGLARSLVRLWPLVLIISIVSFILGLFVMLPDDLENLSESVFASSLFANNILAAITTKDYWDIVNVFKPLMHTWYVGLLLQAYVIIPLLFKIDSRFEPGKSVLLKGLTVLTACSFVLYLLPFASNAQKFYYIPFRCFEICGGGLIAVLTPNKQKREYTKKTYLVEVLDWLY